MRGFAEAPSNSKNVAAPANNGMESLVGEAWGATARTRLRSPLKSLAVLLLAFNGSVGDRWHIPVLKGPTATFSRRPTKERRRGHLDVPNLSRPSKNTVARQSMIAQMKLDDHEGSGPGWVQKFMELSNFASTPLGPVSPCEDAAVEVSDSDKINYVLEARMLLSEGELLKAATYYRLAIRRASTGTTDRRHALLLELADLYDAIGYVNEQISILEQILSENPESAILAEAKERLANVLVDGLGKKRLASVLYREAVETKPSATAMLRQGCVAASEGNYADATQCYVRALQLDNNFADTILYLQVCAALVNQSVSEYTRSFADNETAAASMRQLPSFMRTSWDYIRSSLNLTGFFSSAAVCVHARHASSRDGCR